MAEITNAKMDALRLRLTSLENQRRLPLPTPEVGHIVLFYRHGDLTGTPIPAVVVDRGGPGQVDLKLFVKNSQNQDNAGGIFFREHPFVVENPQVLKLKGGGVWGYCDGDRCTEKHKELHLAEIDKHIKAVNDELRREREEEFRRREMDKAMSAPVSDKPVKQEKATVG